MSLRTPLNGWGCCTCVNLIAEHRAAPETRKKNQISESKPVCIRCSLPSPDRGKKKSDPAAALRARPAAFRRPRSCHRRNSHATEKVQSPSAPARPPPASPAPGAAARPWGSRSRRSGLRRSEHARARGGRRRSPAAPRPPARRQPPARHRPRSGRPRARVRGAEASAEPRRWFPAAPRSAHSPRPPGERSRRRRPYLPPRGTAPCGKAKDRRRLFGYESYRSERV